MTSKFKTITTGCLSLLGTRPSPSCMSMCECQRVGDERKKTKLAAFHSSRNKSWRFAWILLVCRIDTIRGVGCLCAGERPVLVFVLRHTPAISASAISIVFVNPSPKLCWARLTLLKWRAKTKATAFRSSRNNEFAFYVNMLVYRIDGRVVRLFAVAHVFVFVLPAISASAISIVFVDPLSPMGFAEWGASLVCTSWVSIATNRASHHMLDARILV